MSGKKKPTASAAAPGKPAAKKADAKPKKPKHLELLKQALKNREEEAEAEQKRVEQLEKDLAEQEKQREEEERLKLEKREESRKNKEAEIAAQKAAGTYRTPAQIRETEAALARLRLSGNIVPDVSNIERKELTGKRILYTNKKKKPKPDQKVEEKTPEPVKEEVSPPEQEPVPVEADKKSPEPLDDWELAELPEEIEAKEIDEVRPSNEEADESAEDEEEESDDDAGLPQTEEELRAHYHKEHVAAEAGRKTDNLRSLIICVLGHVDTGKTKMLDTIRKTNVQGGEAGGITQQIGATRVPSEAIKERCKRVKDFNPDSIKLPGFLIIDTPGHESFANLRSRGSSLCDMAILVVDIMHGLEPQTIESLQMLVKRQTPFVIALNKIDRLYSYESNPQKDIYQHLKIQPQNTQFEFKERYESVVAQFAEQGINVALSNKNTDTKEFISMVPTSAMLGDGVGNLLSYIMDYSQVQLAQRLAYSEELECIVMEVRSIHGLGTTVDVILINGKLERDDPIVLTGIEGPIETRIRDLLMPAALREIRVKAEYERYKEIKGAQGVKILAKNLETAVAGLPIFRPHFGTDLEMNMLKSDAQEQLHKALTSIKKKAEGVYVQASTLGSLESLLAFLKSQKIPYSGVNIGPVHKKDVQKAAAMHEHNSEFACILAFDVPVDKETQAVADRENVRIFQADIIYHLEDAFLKYREELRLKRRKDNEHLAVFPCKMQVMPQHVFNARNPIVCGVQIVAGQLKKGTTICVPSKDKIVLGTVSSIERNHENVDLAKAGEEVCIKIENTTGEAPKLYGRHFTAEDALVSRITRESINVCKDHFRDDLSKADWQLVVQLKKLLNIM